MQVTYKIIDWAHNECFKGKTFTDFEDAWEYIREQCPNEEDWQEYSVIETKEFSGVETLNRWFK